jgi:glyoxylase-like metal-dependent hydrolase (beta-lactamase superfamily II)
MPHTFGFVHTLSLASVLAIAASVLLSPLSGQQPVSTIPLDPPPPPLVVDGVEILHVQGNVYMLAGAGGNVTVQVGDEGVMIVDTGGPGQAQKVLNALKRVSIKPVRYLTNTSADPDHVAGNGDVVAAYNGVRGPRPQQAGGANPLGQNAGVLTMAYEGTYNRMTRAAPNAPALTGDALPISTFYTAKKEFYSNGEAVQIYAAPDAHTDGDAMVFFRASDVVSTGDVINTASYPVIDTTRGGSISGLLDALNQVIDLAVPERNQMGGTRVIPGHGRIYNETDVVEYRDMVTIIRDRMQEMVKKGMTLQQIKAARISLEYDGLYGTGTYTTDMFLDAVYQGVGGKPAGRAN